MIVKKKLWIIIASMALAVSVAVTTTLVLVLGKKPEVPPTSTPEEEQAEPVRMLTESQKQFLHDFTEVGQTTTAVGQYNLADAVGEGWGVEEVYEITEKYIAIRARSTGSEINEKTMFFEITGDEVAYVASLALDELDSPKVVTTISNGYALVSSEFNGNAVFDIENDQYLLGFSNEYEIISFIGNNVLVLISPLTNLDEERAVTEYNILFKKIEDGNLVDINTELDGKAMTNISNAGSLIAVEGVKSQYLFRNGESFELLRSIESEYTQHENSATEYELISEGKKLSLTKFSAIVLLTSNHYIEIKMIGSLSNLEYEYYLYDVAQNTSIKLNLDSGNWVDIIPSKNDKYFIVATYTGSLSTYSYYSMNGELIYSTNQNLGIVQYVDGDKVISQSQDGTWYILDQFLENPIELDSGAISSTDDGCIITGSAGGGYTVTATDPSNSGWYQYASSFVNDCAIVENVSGICITTPEEYELTHTNIIEMRSSFLRLNSKGESVELENVSLEHKIIIYANLGFYVAEKENGDLDIVTYSGEVLFENVSAIRQTWHENMFYLEFKTSEMVSTSFVSTTSMSFNDYEEYFKDINEPRTETQPDPEDPLAEGTRLSSGHETYLSTYIYMNGNNLLNGSSGPAYAYSEENGGNTHTGSYTLNGYKFNYASFRIRENGSYSIRYPTGYNCNKAVRYYIIAKEMSFSIRNGWRMSAQEKTVDTSDSVGYNVQFNDLTSNTETFSGWCFGTIYASFSWEGMSKGKDYAWCDMYLTPNTYKVTLDNQGATTAGTTVYYYKYSTYAGGDKYYYTNSDCTKVLANYKITKPTRAGYVFGGYFTGSNGTGTQYVDSNGVCINNIYTAVANNTTLYAKWTQNVFKVTLNNQGATTTGTNEYYYKYKSHNGDIYYYTDINCTIQLGRGYHIAIPTKNGYTFAGYFTGEGGTGTQYVDSDGVCVNNLYAAVERDTTLYAKWTKTINLLDNKSSVFNTAWIAETSCHLSSYAESFNCGSVFVACGQTARITQSPPTIPGYTLDGWYSSASGGTRVFNADGSPYTSNTTYWNSNGTWMGVNVGTLYAKWSIKTSAVAIKTVDDGNVWTSFVPFVSTTPAISIKFNGFTQELLAKGVLQLTFKNSAGNTKTVTIDNRDSSGSHALSEFAGLVGYGYDIDANANVKLYFYGLSENITINIGFATDNTIGKYDAGAGGKINNTAQELTLSSRSEISSVTKLGYTFDEWSKAGATKITENPISTGESNNPVNYNDTATTNINEGSMYFKVQTYFDDKFLIQFFTTTNTGNHSVVFKKTSAFNRLRFGLNGNKADLCDTLDVSGYTNEQWYVIEFNITTLGLNSIDFSYNVFPVSLLALNSSFANYTAQWTANTYEVTLNNQGAATAGTTGYYYKYEIETYYTNSNCTTTLSSITKPTKAGYTFGGYYTGTNGTGTQYVNANGAFVNAIYNNVASNVTLYAKWTANTYKVALNNQGATSAGTTGYYYKYGIGTYYTNSNCTTTLSSITKPTKAGYTFGGYYTGTNGTGTQYVNANGAFVDAIYNNVASNVTLYAKWTANAYKVTLDDQESTTAGTTEYYYVYGIGTYYTNSNCTTTLSSITKPTKTGYTFAGYYTGINGTGTQYVNANGAFINNIYSSFASNTTLYAKWTANTGTAYTIEHYFENIDNENYTKNNYYQEILFGTTDTIASVDAISVVGFTYDSTITGSVTSGVIAGNGSLVLKAYYKRNTYKIEYYNGTTLLSTSLSMKHGLITTLASTPTTVGKTFNYWEYEEGSYSAGANFTMPISDVRMAACWTPKTYNITYIENGGTINSGNVTSWTYGSSVSLPTNVTKDGSTFLGWTATNAVGDEAYISKIETIDYGDKSFYAKWTINPYTITLSAGLHGSYASFSQSASYNIVTETCPYLTLPTADSGYQFTGWQTTTAGGNWSLGAFDPISWTTSGKYGNITITAQWETIVYDVTYEENGGTEQTDVTYTIEESVTLPTEVDITKAGYTFLGWTATYNEGDEDYILTIEADSYGDKTFYAKWSANTNTPYAVEIYEQNTTLSGYDLVSTIDNHQGTTDTLATLTDSDKTRTGFTYDSTIPGSVVSGNIAGDGLLILKAYFTRNSYTVTYIENGGIEQEDSIYVYGTTITLPTAPTISKEGYSFDGWYASEDLSGDAITSIATTELGNKVFYAKWTANEHLVTFNLSDKLNKAGETIALPETVPTKFTYDQNVSLPSIASGDCYGWQFVGWSINGHQFDADNLNAIFNYANFGNPNNGEAYVLVPVWEELYSIQIQYFNKTGVSQIKYWNEETWVTGNLAEKTVPFLSGAQVVLFSQTTEAVNANSSIAMQYKGHISGGINYRQTGWNDGSNYITSNGYRYSALNSNITITETYVERASVEFNPVSNFTRVVGGDEFEYAGQIASGISMVEVDKDKTFTEEENRLTDQGYDVSFPQATCENVTFADWWTEQDGDGIQFTSSTPIIESSTVFAYYKATIRYQSVGVDTDIASETVKLMNLFTASGANAHDVYVNDYNYSHATENTKGLVTLYTIDGITYRFDGFYADEVCTTRVGTITQDTTLYAKFVKRVNIVFDVETTKNHNEDDWSFEEKASYYSLLIEGFRDRDITDDDDEYNNATLTLDATDYKITIQVDAGLPVSKLPNGPTQYGIDATAFAGWKLNDLDGAFLVATELITSNITIVPSYNNMNKVVRFYSFKYVEDEFGNMDEENSMYVASEQLVFNVQDIFEYASFNNEAGAYYLDFTKILEVLNRFDMANSSDDTDSYTAIGARRLEEGESLTDRMFWDPSVVSSDVSINSLILDSDLELYLVYQ